MRRATVLGGIHHGRVVDLPDGVSSVGLTDRRLVARVLSNSEEVVPEEIGIDRYRAVDLGEGYWAVVHPCIGLAWMGWRRWAKARVDEDRAGVEFGGLIARPSPVARRRFVFWRWRKP